MNQQQLVRNSIFIDFEGLGKTTENAAPLPHMVGEFKPNSRGKGGVYKAIFFKGEWRPAKNGVWSLAEINIFNSYFSELLIEAKSRQCLIIHWSIHEKVILEKYLPAALFNSLEKYLHNILPDVRRYTNRRRRRILESGEKAHSLDEYFKLWYQKRKPYPPINPGPAETCRRIDAACKSNSRWKNFSDRQQRYVKDLIAYNRGDVECTWLLSLKVANAGFLEFNQ